jgi:RND family efflux transporter MFP subunit
MKKWKRWTLPILALIIGGLSLFLYIKSHPSAGQKPNMALNAGSVLRFKVTRENLSNTVEIKGKSSYQKETYINAPFSADVKRWAVSEGTQVKKGDLLFQLDGTALQGEIAQLQADIKKLELDSTLAKFQETKSGKTDSTTTIGTTEEEAKQRFAEAQSRKIQDELNRIQLGNMQTQLEQKLAKLNAARFTAPEDGIFLFENVKEPQSVTENQRIGKIVDLTKLQLICSVGEYDIFRIKTGMSVDVKVDALKNVALKGKVEKLSKFAKTTADESNATAAEFEVVISLEPNEQLIAGLSLTGTIETDRKENVLVIPTLAIQRDKEQTFVMVEGSQGPEKRIIETGLETPEKTEVISGLKEDETVVIQ